MTSAATDLATIGSNLSAAHAAAATRTLAVLPAAADEVSANIAQLFSQHAAAYQELAKQAQDFHELFTQSVSEAGPAYSATEQFSGTTLTLGGTGEPIWPASLLGPTEHAYGLQTNVIQVSTPEQMWPFVGNMTFNQSVAVGVQNLNAAITSTPGNIQVWACSQSSTVATEEIRNLMAEGSPDQGRLSFILTGDPNNPNGGILERFAGMTIPGMGITGSGATPPNSPYPTAIFTNQYDPVSDFPQYPLNGVADLNAVFGLVQHNYTSPDTDYVQLATSPGYTGHTSYYMDLEPNLPLVELFRDYLPQPWGNAVADLLQPDLRVLVDMGYGSGYANVPTPASLFPQHDWFHILPDLAHGAVQGAQGFAHDLGFPVAAPTGYPYSPVLYPDLNYS
jgi:hypothetical protein